MFNFVIVKVMHLHSNFYGRAVSHFITRVEIEQNLLIMQVDNDFSRLGKWQNTGEIAKRQIQETNSKLDFGM